MRRSARQTCVFGRAQQQNSRDELELFFFSQFKHRKRGCFDSNNCSNIGYHDGSCWWCAERECVALGERRGPVAGGVVRVRSYARVCCGLFRAVVRPVPRDRAGVCATCAGVPGSIVCACGYRSVASKRCARANSRHQGVPNVPRVPQLCHARVLLRRKPGETRFRRAAIFSSIRFRNCSDGGCFFFNRNTGGRFWFSLGESDERASDVESGVF
mmetsp:Transcript_1403/g.2886  ORF Transcript_1403/g.2886 Transcript_1403/m.2886 type:complete len:214 (-) Transcript_1403:1516-2157(-)